MQFAGNWQTLRGVDMLKAKRTSAEHPGFPPHGVGA
jgi:hypothetical protein